MTTIRLIVTGQCERMALAPALGRAFVDGVFDVLPFVYDGFTTHRITQGVPLIRLDDAFEAALGELTRRKAQADYVVVVDDLEVANIGNASVVMAAVADAARRVAAGQSTHRWANLLRTRCSAHLLAPMIESYFFSDPNALVIAGVPTSTQVLREPSDIEEFHTFDAAYLRAAHRDEVGELPFGSAPCVHPKHYLRYLTALAYRETHDGVAATHALKWELVLAERAHARFLRSMFEDISWMLGQPNPSAGETHPATWRSAVAGASSALRNV